MNIKTFFCIIGLLIMVCPISAFGQEVCCSPQGSCSIGGTACLGDFIPGDTCEPNPCPQPAAVPALSEWGMITFMMLAGLGAVYFLRRRTKEKS